MSDVLQDTIEVTVRNEVYVFTIPSFADEIKLGLREREVRRKLERQVFGENYPATGMPTGDNATEFLVRTVAQFEQLLRKGPEWVYSRDQSGGPTIDFEKWPKAKSGVAVEVGVQFGNELARFREDGSAPRNLAGGEAVAGQPNPGNEPVRPDNSQP